MKFPRRIVAVDTETTGLNPYRKTTHAIVISTHNRLGQSKVYVLPTSDTSRVRAELQDRGTLKLFWRAAFDIPILRKAGFRVEGPIIDVMFMAQMMAPDEREHGLKYISRKYLNDMYEEEIALRNYVKKNKIDKNKVGYATVPDHILLPYAQKDAVNTYKLFELFSPMMDELKQWGELKMEMSQMRKVVLPMEEVGLLVDTDHAENLLEEGEQELGILKRKIEKLSGIKGLNPNSPEQVANAIYGEDKENVTRYSGTGKPSTDKLALLEIGTRLALTVIRYRKVSKALGTYLKNINKAVDDNGVFRVSFNQCGAKTGRYSSSGIEIKGQLQNLPRKSEDIGVLGKIREIYCARPGYRFVFIDLDQVEARFTAHFLDDKEMIEAIRKKEDLHALACRRYLDKEPVNPWRYIAKTLQYAGFYGASPVKFQDTVYRESDGAVKIPYDVAATAIEAFRRKTAPLYESTSIEVTKTGGILTYYGRYIPVDSDMIYAAPNYLIQGTAAGYLKRCSDKIADYLKPMKSRIVLTVHDELGFEVHKSERHIVPKLKSMMEDYNTFRVPITASVSIGPSWGTKKSVKV